MKIVFAVFLFIFTFNLYSQNREHAFEVNQRLGRGINYGNMFEAPSETGWGNPWKPQYAKMIADLGDSIMFAFLFGGNHPTEVLPLHLTPFLPFF